MVRVLDNRFFRRSE